MAGKGSRQKRQKRHHDRKLAPDRRKSKKNIKDKNKMIEEAKEKRAAKLEARMIARLKDEDLNPGKIHKGSKLKNEANLSKTTMITKDAEIRTKPNRGSSNRMSLSTSSRDYGGTIDLPEKVTQRQYESTGQFFKRLDRLVAKAKVEASMAARFDYDISKKS